MLLDLDFTDSRLTDVLEQMMSGLLPYSEIAIKNLRTDYKAFIDLTSEYQHLRYILKMEEYETEEEGIALQSKVDNLSTEIAGYPQFRKYTPIEFTNEEFEESLSQIIATKQKNSYMLYDKITKYIHIDEMKLEYYIIMSVLEQIMEIQRSSASLGEVTTNINLTRERLDYILDNGSELETIITKKYKEIGIQEFCASRGIKFNLNDRASLGELLGTFYRRTMDLYDRLVDSGLSTGQSLSYELELRVILKKLYAESTISIGAQILNDSFVLNRKKYEGPEGYFEYTAQAIRDLEERMSLTVQDAVHSYEDLDKMRMDRKSAIERKQCEFGVPPIDEIAGIATKNEIVLTAQPGTGKTQFACQIASRLIANNERVLYFSTETISTKIQAQIQSAYALEVHDTRIPYKQMMNEDTLDEDMKKVTRLIEQEFHNKNGLIVRNTCAYSDFKSIVTSHIIEDGVTSIIVDYASGLTQTSGNSLYEDLKELCDAVKFLKLAYPVSFVILTHLSSAAQKELTSRVGEISKDTYITADSAQIHKDADYLFYLQEEKRDSLDNVTEESFILIRPYKARDKKCRLKTIRMREDFDVCSMYYEESDQIGGSGSDVEESEVMGNVTEDTLWD